MEPTPSFFVIGAQKAGTSTLHEWLTQQPEVRLPKTKETHFFSHPERFARGLGWYLRQFAAARETPPVTGEIDPDYAFFPGTPERLRGHVPEPRFVFVLRHPLERAHSHYLMSVRRGFEDLGFVEALRAEPGRLASGGLVALGHFSYLARGRYTEQIRRFQKVFPEAPFWFVKFEDLVSRSKGFATYEGICRFVGVRSSPTLADRSVTANEASQHRSTLLRDLIYRKSPWKRAIGRLLGNSTLKRDLAVFLDRLNRKKLGRRDAGLPGDLPPDLAEEAGREALRLQELTGLDVRDWLGPRTRAGGAA